MQVENIIKRPLMLTEKGTTLRETQNQYLFEVDRRANKIQIRQAVDEIFEVTVVKVNTMNRPGKRMRNRRALTYGKRPDTKRAVVTLVAGDRIDLFEGGA